MSEQSLLRQTTYLPKHIIQYIPHTTRCSRNNFQTKTCTQYTFAKLLNSCTTNRKASTLTITFTALLNRNGGRARAAISFVLRVNNLIKRHRKFIRLPLILLVPRKKGQYYSSLARSKAVYSRRARRLKLLCAPVSSSNRVISHALSLFLSLFRMYSLDKRKA